MVITLPPPPRAIKHWGKTPESPKIPLQLGCSVTQIRHFFKRTFFNLPLIFENNVKKATVWLHQGGKTSPSMLRIATAPAEGRLWHSAKLCLFARGSPTRGNGDDRRQWRKQGGAVGAAASRMRAAAKQTLGAATRPWRAQARLRGCMEGKPDQRARIRRFRQTKTAKKTLRRKKRLLPDSNRRHPD